MELVWSETAKKQFSDIFYWTKTEMGEAVALWFKYLIIDAVKRIKENPEQNELRSLLKTKAINYRSDQESAPYEVVYFIENGKICIADIWILQNGDENE